jgi:hypothetical protein
MKISLHVSLLLKDIIVDGIKNRREGTRESRSVQKGVNRFVRRSNLSIMKITKAQFMAVIIQLCRRKRTMRDLTMKGLIDV